MEFTVTTSGNFYHDAKKRTALKKIGFTFKESDYKEFTIVGEPIVDIIDLKELIQFADKWGKIIVGNGNIEIYDDYRE
jgi:hypothetical protein